MLPEPFPISVGGQSIKENRRSHSEDECRALPGHRVSTSEDVMAETPESSLRALSIGRYVSLRILVLIGRSRSDSCVAPATQWNKVAR